MKSTLYRVWNIINVDDEGFGKTTVYMYVSSPIEGAKLINTLSKFELQFSDDLIGSNVFGMECRDAIDGVWDGDWCEWYDEDGNDVEYLADNIKEQ